MDATETDKKELTFDDIDIEVPESSTDFETIPAGMYNARLVGFSVTDKPDWKLKGEEGEDKKQWEWTFEITDGDYAGTRLSDWTNRTWHEKSNAHKHAAALLGVPSLPVGIGMSTKQLAGKGCQLWVVEVPTKKDANTLRNYIDKVTPTPAPRMRPQRAQNGSQQTLANPALQVDEAPGDDGDIPF